MYRPLGFLSVSVILVSISACNPVTNNAGDDAYQASRADINQVPITPEVFLFDTGRNSGRRYDPKQPSLGFEAWFRANEDAEVISKWRIQADFETFWSAGSKSSRHIFRAPKNHHGLEWKHLTNVVAIQNVRDGAESFADDSPSGNLFMRNNNLVYVSDKRSESVIKRIRSSNPPLIEPVFRTSKSDIVELACDVDVKDVSVNKPNDIMTWRGVEWKLGDRVGRSTYSLFIDYNSNKWSASAFGDDVPSPRDLDGNGEIWEPIVSGSDAYICFDHYGYTLQEGLPFGNKYFCAHGINMQTGEYRSVNLPKDFKEIVKLDSKQVEVKRGRPLGWRGDWRREDLRLQIGTCNEIK